MQTREITSCPICAGDLCSLGISEDYDVKALGTRVIIDFAICQRCGFVCQGCVLPLDALMLYYQDSPKLREAVASHTDLTLFAAQAKFMEHAGALRGKRVLDIGADMGKLLDFLSVEFGCLTYYEEENRTAQAWLLQAERHKDAAGVDADTPFDWIVLSEVLEHIIDPVPMLVGLRSRLASDGKLFIEVPNHGAWDDLDIGFCFEHVNYFSPASLTAALDRGGYHLVTLDVTTDQHYLEGRCRIIRACAQPRAPGLIQDAARVVRDHERKQKLNRIGALETLVLGLRESGQVGLAVYGAAELADHLLRRIEIIGGSIIAVFDSDVRKQGSRFRGLLVRPPADIVEINPTAIVILSSAEADIRRTIALSGYAGRVICWSDL